MNLATTSDRLAYFAAHAPEVPDWFEAKTWWERKIVDCTEGPNAGRPGYVMEKTVNCVEDPLARLVRWRKTYAEALLKELNANS